MSFDLCTYINRLVDLPTPITCKSGGCEKKAQKNLEIQNLKPGDFKNKGQKQQQQNDSV